jgi:hypothetical protein
VSTLAAIAKTILALAQFFDSLMRGVATRRATQAGEDRATAQSLKEQNTRVEKARAARRAAGTGGLQDHDPYRRD